MKILVADDEITTRMLLQQHLCNWGYDVVCVDNGADALDELSAEDYPGIAILDWAMPEMDGLEVCQEFHSRSESPFIYTIMLTGRNDRDSLVKALEAGAHEFLNKPVDPAELKTRITVGRRLVDSEAILKEYAANMESLAQERARALVHADRLVTMGTITAGLAHEINNPLGAMKGFLELLEEATHSIKANLDSGKGVTDLGHAKTILDDSGDIFKSINNCYNRAAEIIKGLRSFSRRGDQKRVLYQINDCIEEALRLCNNSLKYKVTVERKLDANLPKAEINPGEIVQVLLNLIVNATHAMEENEFGNLTISSFLDDDYIQIHIEDDGPGIPREKLEEIWKSFYTTKNADKGTGLGLSISKGIIEAHQGQIHAENVPEKGARFVIRLPIVQSAKQQSSAELGKIRDVRIPSAEEVMQEIGLEYDEYLEVLDGFLQDLKEKLVTLEKGIKRNDKDMMHFISHSFKGSALNLRIDEIANLASIIDNYVREEKYDRIPDKFTQLRDIINVFGEKLKMMDATPSSASAKEDIPTAEEISTPAVKNSEMKPVIPADDSGHTQTVLVAESQISNLKLISNFLTENGYRVISTTSGEKAFTEAKNTKPDLCILDTLLPDINGYELCERFKQEPGLKEIPVIFLTAHNSSSELIKAFEKGAVDFICKPFNKVEVLMHVKLHLSMTEALAEIRRLQEIAQDTNS